VDNATLHRLLGLKLYSLARSLLSGRSRERQVASVGLTERDAKDVGLNTRSVDSDIGNLPRCPTKGGRIRWSCQVDHR
jgi:hypothetical protein